jgi:hypothetical protein
VLVLNTGIIFVFAIVKMDTTPKKLAKIVALNEQTSITVRVIASVVGVGKSSMSKITFMEGLRITLSKKKRKMWKKTKTHSY